MAVQMDRVRNRYLRVNDPVDPLVCVRQLVHVLSVLPGRVAFSNLKKGWVVPDDVHAVEADIPLEQLVGVRGYSDSKLRVLKLWRLNGVLEVWLEQRVVDIDTSIIAVTSPRRGCWIAIWSATIAYNTTDIVAVVVVGAGSLGDGTEPVIRGFLIGFDYHIVALTHSEVQNVDFERFNGNKVHGDDRHLMAIKRELEERVDRCIYKAHSVLLALLECHFVALAASAVVCTLAVDESSIHIRRANSLSIGVKSVDSRVTPVSNDDGLKINIVVSCSWAMNDDGTKNTSPSLESVVRVVPAGSVLCCTKGVRVCCAGLKSVSDMSISNEGANLQHPGIE